MSEPLPMHVAEQRLQRFADGELDAAEADAVRRHVEGCAVCARSLDGIRVASDAYRSIHDAVKAADPAPPRPWADLRTRMEAPERGGRWKAWAAVAAAVVVGLGVYYRMTGPTPVRAAELLRRAVAAEPPKNPARRIRVRTKKGVTVRPAVGTVGVSGELAGLFAAARFNWEDPLSARSFSEWRDGLAQKQDSVRQSEHQYEIETTTSSGPLTSATLVLDARDLHPVRETLEFPDDRIEITEAEPAPEPVTPRMPIAPAPRPQTPAASETPAELQALVALHNIGADLGEPVRVEREGGAVVVSAAGLTAARERQVKEAVAGIPGVVWRAEEIDAGPAETLPPRRSAAPVASSSPLARRLGEDGVNRILDASEAVMARVYALRGLSRRFPAAREAQLADADRHVLDALRREHVSGIRRHLSALEAALAPVASGTALAATELGPWQQRAERLFVAARSLDQLLTVALAGSGESKTAEITSAAANLEAAVAVEERQ